MGFGVWGFGVWGLGFRALDLGLWVFCPLGFRVSFLQGLGLGFRVVSFKVKGCSDRCHFTPNHVIVRGLWFKTAGPPQPTALQKFEAKKPPKP